MELAAILIIIGTIIAIVIGLIMLFKQQPKSKYPQTAAPFPISEYRLSPSPGEITNSIKKLSPFQQQEACNNYTGVKVQWYVKLSGIKPLGDFLPGEPSFYLLSHDVKDGIGVNCQIDVSEYPELKIIPHAHKMWIAGTIKNVDTMWINLTDVRLSISSLD